MDRWIEQRAHVVVGHYFECFSAQLRSEVDKVFFANALHFEWWWLSWDGLCSRQFLARNFGSWNSTILHWPDWLASHAIEGIHIALLGYLSDCRHYASAGNIQI